MAELLVKDHEELDALKRGLFEAFGRGDADRVPSKLDVVWARLAVHIRAEHLHLFPALLSASEAAAPAAGLSSAREVEEALSRLREDHNFFMRERAACVEALGRQGAGERPNSVGELEAVSRRVLGVFERLGQHNRLEEEEVYVWAGALPVGAERDRLDADVRKELENLLPRFAGSRG